MPEICIELSENQVKLLKIVAVVELTTEAELDKEMVLEGLAGSVDVIGTTSHDELVKMLDNFRSKEEH